MGQKSDLSGKRLTPFPINFVLSQEDEGPGAARRAFITKRGHMKAVLEKKEVDLGPTDDGVEQKKIQRHITLYEILRVNEDGSDTEAGSLIIQGTVNIKYDRITWDNGSMWARQGATKADRDREAAEQAQVKARDAVALAAVRIAHDPEAEAADQEVEDKGGLWICSFCRLPGTGDKEDANAPLVLAPPEDDPPAAPPRDLDKGFFSEEQLDDIIDRINEVVGIWGVSEETEREYIKPPVVAMNKMIKTAMETFLDNPIIDLFHFIMDEAMDLAQKAKAFARFLHDRFIKPLCAALMERLSDSFEAVSWIKGQVEKVVLMLSSMVTDEIVTKSVEQLQDSPAVS